MIQADKTRRIPSYNVQLDFSWCIMHAPYVDKRWKYLQSRRWVEDSIGISLYELYADFARLSGWLVPLNVSSIPAAERPDFLQCDIKGRIRSHEYDWPALQLRRQAFSDQVATLRKILSYAFRLQGIPWAFQRSKSLQSLGGALPFCSLSWRPTSTLDGITVDRLRSMQEGRTIRA